MCIDIYLCHGNASYEAFSPTTSGLRQQLQTHIARRRKWSTMSKEIILEDSKVCHGSVYQTREWRITTCVVLCNDDIAPPRVFFFEAWSLNPTNSFVDREWHSIACNDWVEDDVRIRKFAVHAIEGLHELQDILSTWLLLRLGIYIPGTSMNVPQCLRRSVR